METPKVTWKQEYWPVVNDQSFRRRRLPGSTWNKQFENVESGEPVGDRDAQRSESVVEGLYDCDDAFLYNESIAGYPGQ
jgi:hypothetical protein